MGHRERGFGLAETMTQRVQEPPLQRRILRMNGEEKREEEDELAGEIYMYNVGGAEGESEID